MSENIKEPNIPTYDAPMGDSSIPQGPDPQLSTPRPKSPLLATILAIILTVVAVIAVYLFLQVRALTLDKTTPSPTPTPVAVAGPTANWQRFTHPTQRYSLQYPADIIVLIDESTEANSVFLPSDDPYNIIGGIEVRELKLTPEEWIALEEKSGVVIFEQLTHSTSFTSGIKIKASKAMDYYAYVISREDMLYVVSLIITSQDDNELFDQIISTFNFIEE